MPISHESHVQTATTSAHLRPLSDTTAVKANALIFVSPGGAVNLYSVPAFCRTACSETCMLVYSCHLPPIGLGVRGVIWVRYLCFSFYHLLAGFPLVGTEAVQMASSCALSQSNPCTWCETDELIAACPSDLADVVRQYCSSKDVFEAFFLCAHLGGECRRCLEIILEMCHKALHTCQRAPREWSAEDVSQTLFQRILKSHWDSAKGPLGGWLKVIIDRIIIDAMKAAYVRHTRTAGDDLINQAPNNEESYDSAELASQRDLRERLAVALSTLPLEPRQLITLRFVEGYSLQAIANELAVPLATVARRIQKALDRLSEILNEAAGRPNAGGVP
jgi:RNA polymerase sigma factor (sigma-70 family)